MCLYVTFLKLEAKLLQVVEHTGKRELRHVEDEIDVVGESAN